MDIINTNTRNEFIGFFPFLTNYDSTSGLWNCCRFHIVVVKWKNKMSIGKEELSIRDNLQYAIGMFDFCSLDSFSGIHIVSQELQILQYLYSFIWFLTCHHVCVGEGRVGESKSKKKNVFIFGLFPKYNLIINVLFLPFSSADNFQYICIYMMNF